MSKSKPVHTAVNVNDKLKLYSSAQVESVDKNTYQTMVGSLLYLSNWTRPDITFAVHNVVSYCYCTAAQKEHAIAVKSIFRYLDGTVVYDIGYVKRSHDDCVVIGMLIEQEIDRKSTSGYVLTLGGAPISWKSKKQSCAALSTAEAEYVSLSSASQEAVWLKRMLQDFGVTQSKSVIMLSDSQSAIAIAKDSSYHGRVKHIEIKYHLEVK